MPNLASYVRSTTPRTRRALAVLWCKAVLIDCAKQARRSGSSADLERRMARAAAQLERLGGTAIPVR